MHVDRLASSKSTNKMMNATLAHAYKCMLAAMLARCFLLRQLPRVRRTRLGDKVKRPSSW
eukprot:5722672-Alexandrium_andersonii.AAC.1